jgi:hypothetical protein
MKTVKAVVVWTLCGHWGLFLLSYIPTFRMTNPLTGADTETTFSWTAGSVFGPLMMVLTFVALLWTALALTRTK